MGRLSTLVLVVAIAGFVAVDTAQADEILYWVDGLAGTDRMAEALADPVITGAHNVTYATSQADFDTKIGSGLFDLGILLQQQWGDTDFSALTTFVAGGGRAIVTDWTLTDSNIAGFDAAFVGTINDDSVTVTDAALAAGLSNPVLLMDPGWGVWTMDLATLPGGVASANFTGRSETAIVTGNGGRTIMNGFLSDTFQVGADGKQLYINEIQAVLGDSPEVPEPGTLGLLALGLGSIAVIRRRRCRP